MESNYIKVLEKLEKQNYRLKCYYNTCIKLLDYDFKNKNIEGDGKKRKYIYGCGDIGKRYYKIIKNSSNVLGFIDQSAKENTYKYEDVDVISLEKLDINSDFDYIVITIEDMYQIIYDDLINMGISSEKIKSIDEMIS